MKTKRIEWAKTVLIAYKYLGSMCAAIDKIIKNLAISSHFAGGAYCEKSCCEVVSKKIIALTNKKIDYINLKVLTEKALENMNKKNAKLLILRTIKELNVSTIAEVMNMSERTYFRRISDAENEFCVALEKLGLNIYKLEIEYLADNFIKSIYKIVCKHKGGINSLDAQNFDDNVVNYFIKDYVALLC